MLTIRSIFKLLVALFWAIALGQSCAELLVRPTKLVIPAQSRTETIVFLSSAEKTRRFEINVVVWTQQGDEDKLVPSEALIVSPPVFALYKDKPQVIRVLRAGLPDPQRELSYRLLINEITAKPRGPATGVPVVALNMSLPVFLSPVESANAEFDVELKPFKSPEGTDKRTLTVKNRGVVHVQGSQLTRLRSGSEFGDAIPLFGYALPGTQRKWIIEDRSLGEADAIRVRFASGYTQDFPLRTP